MRTLFLILFHFILSNCLCQDTLFSVRYPNGIITDSITFKHKRYHISPIENTNRKIVIPQKTLYIIHYSNGEVFSNKRLNPNSYMFLETNKVTGEIEYTGKVKINTPLNLLDDLSKEFNTENVTFHSIYRSKDSAIYQGRFNVKHAGDDHFTYFKLNLIHTANSAKILINNLKTCHDYLLSNDWEIMDTLNPVHFRSAIDLTKMYSTIIRVEDSKTFWEPIHHNLKNTVHKVENYFNPNEIEHIPPTKIKDSLSVFRNLSYIEGLTGYSNYFDKNEINKPETANKNLISIGFQFGVKWNFGSNTNYKFGLNLHIASIEMFIGDKDPGFSFTIGEIGPCFTKKITSKSAIDLGLSFGLSSYLRIGSGNISPSVTGNPALKSNFELKYRFQKFVFGAQLNNRYPINMNSISLLIGYSFN